MSVPTQYGDRICLFAKTKNLGSYQKSEDFSKMDTRQRWSLRWSSGHCNKNTHQIGRNREKYKKT